MTKEEFVRQVEESRGGLYRIACAYLRTEADRLDAVQEALLKAWQSRHRLREEQHFRTWLTRILIRECVNIQRRQRRMIPMDTMPQIPVIQTSENPALRDAILQLPDSMRIVVVLFYMEGYAAEEIARILHVPKGTVCSRLSRAREKIKEIMKEEAPC